MNEEDIHLEDQALPGRVKKRRSIGARTSHRKSKR